MNQGFISKLSETEKKFFYITILIVLVSLLDRLFLGPAIDQLQEIHEEVVRQENSIKRDLRFLSYKDQILEEGKVLDKYAVEKLPEEDVINNKFFSTVEKLANRSNVNLIKSNPAQAIDEKDFVQYYANLECAGDLKDMISFIHLLNSTNDLFKIVKFELTPKHGGSMDSWVTNSYPMATSKSPSSNRSGTRFCASLPPSS